MQNNVIKGKRCGIYTPFFKFIKIWKIGKYRQKTYFAFKEA